jgi:hypothetical protein
MISKSAETGQPERPSTVCRYTAPLAWPAPEARLMLRMPVRHFGRFMPSTRKVYTSKASRGMSTSCSANAMGSFG